MLCRSARTPACARACTVELRLPSIAEARTRGAATTTARPRRLCFYSAKPPSRRRRPGEARSDAGAVARRAYRDGVDRHAIAPRPNPRDETDVTRMSLEIFQDPVIAADGHSYERREIGAWLARGKTTSPKTNAELPHAFLVPNRHLKAMCQQFLDEVREVEEAGG